MRNMSSTSIDPFTQRRMIRFVQDFRARNGQLPTFRDFSDAGFAENLVKQAVRARLLEELFVTLTNGTIVKGIKVPTET